MADTKTHNIVILGGSFAGVSIAHGVLKSLPQMRKDGKKDFKVIMISNSTHFWYTPGAPRAMFKPYPKDLMDSFIPISKGFSKYPSSDFEFVFGEITQLNTDTKDVTYQSKTSDDEVSGTTANVHYDTLVIATGSKGPDPLFSYHGSHQPTLNAYIEMHKKIPSAKSVIVIGGGTAGVETAGELGDMFGKKSSQPKDISIYSGQGHLLSGLANPKTGARAESVLQDMGVKVINNARSVSTTKLPSGQTQIKFDNGDTKTVDVLIVATGRRPYAPYLPSSFKLNKEGRIESDGYFLATGLQSVYAAGDMSGLGQGGLVFANFAHPILIGNIIAGLSGKGPGKEYKPMTKDTQLIPLGPNDGVGVLFGWRLPALMVKMLKSKNYMFPKAMETVMG